MRSLIWLTQALEKDWTLTIEQLQNQLAYAEQRSAPLRSIQILAQLAIVCQKQSKEKDAHDYLQRAIILAEPGGFVHTFVDLGPEMAELLNQTIAQADFAEATLAYANQVLEAFPATTPEVDPIQAALLRAQSIMSEPLTPREVEVLFLLNEGWKPREIAEELFISLHTVKKHTSNAYSKLDVGSREEAIAKSFALGLFSPE